MLVTKPKTNAAAYLYIHRKKTLLEKLINAKREAWELKQMANAQIVK